jgi:hypothetical protein
VGFVVGLPFVGHAHRHSLCRASTASAPGLILNRYSEPMHVVYPLTTVERMRRWGSVRASGRADDSRTWFEQRRAAGVIGALAAGVVGVISVLDLDEVRPFDLVALAAAVGAYVLYGAVRRFPAWGPFVVACVSVVVLNLPDLEAEGAMFFIVLGLAHLALHDSRRWIPARRPSFRLLRTY